VRIWLVLPLVLLVVVPVAALTWATARLSQDEAVAIEARELAAARAARQAELAVAAEAVGAVLERAAARLDARLPEPLTVEALSLLARSEPLLRGAAWQRADGGLAWPDATRPLTADERSLLSRLGRPLSDRAFLHESPSEVPTGRARAAAWVQGWSDEGLSLVRVLPRPDGGVVVLELNRARLVADVIAALPAASEGGACASLFEGSDVPLHRWGTCPAASDAPAVDTDTRALALSAPLAPWHLEVRYPLAAVLERVRSFQAYAATNTATAAAALGLALAALALGLGWATTRAVREARERVSFVNRVSHELKTPLTNVRLYAELLAARLPDDDPKAARFAAVIIDESRRLGRMIENVLVFGRRQRRALELRPAPAVVDEVVTEVLETFRPGLAERGLALETSLEAPMRVLVDDDALGQILGNLVGNAEKYAAGGGWLRVQTRQDAARTVVEVADRGPGIPPDETERVFRPFYRLRDSVREGASGTGIGLAIARELARLHGGDVRLVPGGDGARFRVELATPPAPPDEGGAA
jgi:signal transduction histidine kinase